MNLVECAVHAHRGAEPHQLLVLPEACQDGCQGGCAEIGRAEGDDGADVLDRILSCTSGRFTNSETRSPIIL